MTKQRLNNQMNNDSIQIAPPVVLSVGSVHFPDVGCVVAPVLDGAFL
jgi:hypothetical protein